LYPDPTVAWFNSSGFLSKFPRTRALAFFQAGINFSSNSLAVVAYDFLAYHKAQIALKDGSKIWGTYLFTIDWYNNPYSDEPSDYKCGHIFKADDGYLLCQPNNRIFWKDSNWVTKPLPEDLKQFKVDTELPSVENQSDRWVTEDGDAFYYSMNETV